MNITFRQKDWDAYLRVNELFAEKIVDLYRPGDLIFIQDYHFMPLPLMIRKRIPHAKIGFFFHTPFPTSELFRVLATREELLKGVLGSNLIGFQTYDHSRHFLSSCTRILKSDQIETSHKGVNVFEGNTSRYVSILICPTGVSADKFLKSLDDPKVVDRVEELRNTFKGKKVIIGRDQYDTSKGIIQKLLAFEEFLAKYPEWLGKVVLVQVCINPRKHEHRAVLDDYRRLTQQINELVGRINGKFGKPDYSPIIYVANSMQWHDLVAFYRIADVFMLTSLKDGLNLTSHEYVICQHNKPGGPGAVILSEFAGVSQSLSGSIRINPWDSEQMVTAINQALTMDIEERREKQRFNFRYTTKMDGLNWATTFLAELQQGISPHNAFTQVPNQLNNENIVHAYKNAKKRIFFLDYDGTLAPIVSKPGMAVPTKSMLNTLSMICQDPKNTVYVVSGRDRQVLEEWVGHLPVGLSAEHGCFVRRPRNGSGVIPDWDNAIEHLDNSWKVTVSDLFLDYTERTPGSSVENKDVNITWHYRNADPNYSDWVSKELLAHLTHGIASKLPIEILIGKKAIEVRPKEVNKGTSIRRILKTDDDFDFVCCIGDDKTDEDMFQTLSQIYTNTQDLLWTIVVEEKPSIAQYYIQSQEDVLILLDKLVV